MYRCKNRRIGPTQNERNEYREDNRDVDRNDILNRFFKVTVDLASHGNRVGHAREVVIGEYDGGNLFRNLRTLLAHGNTDMRSLERGTVIHPVTRHGN